MTKLLIFLALFLEISVTSVTAAQPKLSDQFKVSKGTYRIALPRDLKKPAPVVMYFHGLGGSSKAVIKNSKLVKPAIDKGYIFIALEGAKRPSSKHRNWAIRDGVKPWRNEVDYIHQVIDDVSAKFLIDRSRITLAGFSRGGSAVWDIACYAPKGFAAFAPAGGALWSPLPHKCSQPVRLMHSHGWRDNTVPIEGRIIPNKNIRQGDVFASMSLLRSASKLNDHKPEKFSKNQETMCRSWAQNNLRLCIYPQGHSIPHKWMSKVITWFEALPSG